ncbi:DUF2235 domain-containing protein [Microbulbifer variabilis]|uniref:DUF2235 domain-containing protein n=1 Tax=Microbulbifer variabilis TaxID=266805 RepID=UPI00039E0265|nr:DUF2235 domain-containing protein [Microbulbifer variabilis]
MTTKRLILLFDGTWNDPVDETNVFRILKSIHDFDNERRQLCFYDPGVGTSTFSRLLGGVTGWGLSENLIQGYEWLIKNFTEGDEIWIFGFSRGAYTARSLAGMIRKCGLLHNSAPQLIVHAEKFYRDKRYHPDHEESKRFRNKFSHEVDIYFLGVWDTVGALGVPGFSALSESGKYAWHDTELSGNIKYAYHAVALDEHRSTYDTSLWSGESGKKKERQTEVEQRWFIGAHANVGGGYVYDSLSEIPLYWMQQKAMKAGLQLNPYQVSEDAWRTPPKDSYQNFLKGAYALVKRTYLGGDGRFHREFSRNKKGLKAINVTVDPSVWRRWESVPEYRPPTLTRVGQSPP